MKFLDIKGQKFGRWLALERDLTKTDKKATYWKCECECGKYSSVTVSALINAKSTRCRSCAMRDRHLDLPKGRYGEWNVLEYRENGMWLCECSCGKQQEVSRSHLVNKQGKSCFDCRSKFSKGKRINVKVGDKYGKWTVEEIYTKAGYRTQCLCVCECGFKKVKAISEIKYHQKSGCKKCGKQWSGYKEISGTFWGAYRQSAEKRKLEFNITLEYIWNLFLEQNRRCALTNLPLSFNLNPADKLQRAEQTASLDRIDSSFGYIEGNVQWVHKDINRMKSDFTEDYFKQLCKLVMENCT